MATLDITPQRRAAFQRASHVQAVLEAELGPGGKLHWALDDLIGRADVLALDAAGVPVVTGEPPADWRDGDDLTEHLCYEIAEAFFQVALHHAEKHPDEVAVEAVPA